MGKINRWYLLAAALVLSLSVLGMALLAATVPAEDYAVRLDAARRMQRCMDRVREYKLETGLGVSEDDRLGTGMIGAPYTLITTTSGALEAKRTTANADMAALVVKMLREAGVQSGDTVGAGFSGSFPALNLAVLAACEAMDVKLVYIASVGASTYGANQPELTFPDMVCRLAGEGLVSEKPAALSLGGAGDCGFDMDAETVAAIRQRLDGYGVPMLYLEDYAENIAARMAIYKANGPIACFIGVGGNLTTIGKGEDTVPYGLVRPYTVKTVNAAAGLMQRYNAEGLPVLHLLNIKKLAADYGLPYDPETPSAPGKSTVYFERRYPWPLAAMGLLLAGALLLLGRRAKRLAALCAALFLLAGCTAKPPVEAELPAVEELPAGTEPAPDIQPQSEPAPDTGPADWTLADFAPCLSGGYPTQTEQYCIGAGAAWEATVTVLRGEEAGETVYLVGGIHGDETAGWTAGNLAKEATLKAGTVYILSPANAYGAAHDQRETESGRDLNRNFPGDPEGWDAERLAAAIYADIADKQPALVLDLHEARGARPDWDDLSNSIIVQDVQPVGELVWDMLLDSESGRPGSVPLTLMGGPPAGSINQAVSDGLGIPVITLETWRGEELATRVGRQLAVIEYVLHYYGLR